MNICSITAVIAALLPLFARTGIIVHDSAGKGSWANAGGASLWRRAPLLNWGYRISDGISAGRYIERSYPGLRPIPYQLVNRLRVREIVAMLEREASGIAFTDAQWGNPGTALEVYQPKRFPNLRIVPISR